MSSFQQEMLRILKIDTNLSNISMFIPSYTICPRLSPQMCVAHWLMLFRKIFRPTLCSQNVKNTSVNKIFVHKAALFKFEAPLLHSTVVI